MYLFSLSFSSLLTLLVYVLFDEKERDILVNCPSLTEMGVIATGRYATVDTFISSGVVSDDKPRSGWGLLANSDTWVLTIQRPTVNTVPLQLLPHDILHNN